MGITFWRGRLFRYLGPIDGLELIQEVTLDEYLAIQYTPALLERYPDQARADRDRERRKIERALMPGDNLWLWKIVDTSNQIDGVPLEGGGVAIRRNGVLVHVWQTWCGR